MHQRPFLFSRLDFFCEKAYEKEKGGIMLVWALIFLVVALVAGIFGFRGVEGIAMQIAKVLFFLFLVLFIISLIMSFSNPPMRLTLLVFQTF